MVAVGLEVLRQGDHLGQRGAEMGVEVPHPRRIRPPPGQQRTAGRAAHRLLAIGVLEHDAARREAVNIGGFDHLIAITTHFRAQVVHRDEQDVGAGRCGGGGGKGQRRGT